MQTLARYFGFRVELTEELDPARFEVLVGEADRISGLEEYKKDPDQFFVYFHQLGIILDESHFAHTMRFDARVKSIRLTFERNHKQRRNREIRFYNYLVDNPTTAGVRCISSDRMVIYEIDGGYLAERRTFRNELITFVSKTLRRDFRKIKVSVQAYPTTIYDQRLRKKGSKVTRVDLRYDRFTPVRIPNEDAVQKNPGRKLSDLQPNAELNDLVDTTWAGSLTKVLSPDERLAFIRVLVGMDEFSTSVGRKTALGVAGLARFSNLPETDPRLAAGRLLLRLEAEKGKPHPLCLLINYALDSDVSGPEKEFLRGLIKKYMVLQGA